MNPATVARNPFRSARYLVSAHRLDQLPEDSGFEVAFAGRSNAGKSSAINTLCDQKALARTSKTPGRTQQIVVLAIDAERRIADLPGYGYARVPEKLRAHWQGLMRRYFEARRSLRGVVLVMDARHPLRPFDEQMLAWCEASDLPCHVLLTKSDKLKRGPAAAALQQVRDAIGPQASAQSFSAHSGEGLGELVARLETWYGLEQPAQDSPQARPPARIPPATTGHAS